jgi:branched-chain amino acid transport system substrate-binding protein
MPRRALIHLLVGLLLFLTASCGTKPSLRIGFLGTFTGRFSDLSTSGHNGAILAIEECNQEGGVQGRTVELLEEDDRADEASAVAGLRGLVSRGCVAVVGPMISKTALPVATVATRLNVVVVGPTISSNQLTGIDDAFFRVYTPSEYTSRQLAREVRALGMKRAIGLYDLTNRAHTEGAYLAFHDEFVKLGGEMLPPISFAASEQPSFTELARRVVDQKADSVFVLMGSMDTALFSQCLWKMQSKLLLCCSDWSGTGDLAEFAGRSIDGLVFLHSMDPQANRPWADSYRKRFGKTPDFGALRSYEAAWVLLQALRKSPDPAALHAQLLSIRTFRIGESVIEFDAYGDVVRAHHPFRFVAGKMEPLHPTP